jgi:hypothetical protein
MKGLGGVVGGGEEKEGGGAESLRGGLDLFIPKTTTMKVKLKERT